MIELILGLTIGFISGIITTFIYFYRKIRKFDVESIIKDKNIMNMAKQFMSQPGDKENE